MKKNISAKLWIAMKIGAIQIILTIILCEMAMAHDNFAQILNKKITLSINNVPFEKALVAIENAAQIKFAYSPDQLREEEIISLTIDNQSLAWTLARLLTPRNINYVVHEKTATITLKKITKSDQQGQDLTKASIRPVERLDPIYISGTVTEASGKQPLPGVNILIKGSTKGTTTGADGTYRIEVETGDILVFSFIGYKSKDVLVGNQSVINIILEEDSYDLKEVIINAGYWKINEREQTGNIAKLSAEEIERQPASNMLQAMQGKMAGVYIQQQSGIPGGSFNIQIRGQNSLRNSFLNNGNRPLYIVDGVPFISEPLGTSNSATIIDGGNPLSNINAADIESIEVLKDADATAIYGSRGANGVVLITTKSGKPGQTQFNLNVYQGSGRVARKMDLLNTQQYLEMRNEAFANDELTPGTYFPDHDLLSWDQNRYTDWQKELLGGAAGITSGQLSASGGSANTRFMIAANYFRESTVFPGDFKDQKASTNFKLNHTSQSGKWEIDYSGYYLVDDNRLPRIDLTGQALALAPNAPDVYNVDGSLNWENSTWENPIAILHQEFTAKTSNLVNNAIVGFQITPALQAKVNVGYSEIRFNEFTSVPKASRDPAKVLGSSSTFADKKANTWITEPQLEHKWEKGKGTLTTLIGSTFQESNATSEAFRATGFSNDALLRNLQAASAITVTSTDASQYRYNAIFGRINYNWNNRYLLNLTGRRDGSSRFGPGKQFANFGAAGAAWIFTEEEFLNVPFISFGKVRMSYGATGSDQIGNYGYLDLWKAASYSYDGITGLRPVNLANEDYAWEINRKWEAGLELGLWQDKINISLSYYNNKADNQLVGVPLPIMVGFSSVQANFPAEVSNKGLEANWNSVNIDNEKFTWSTTFNITVPTNKLEAFPDFENSSYAYDYVVGKPLSIKPTFHHLGIDKSTGLYLHEDVNKDDQLSSDDLLGLKGPVQNCFGGFQNTLTFKQISLDVFIQFVKQTGYNYLSYFYDRPGTARNQPSWVLNRWQNPGDSGPIQKYTQGYGEAYLANIYDSYSDNIFGDASFIRLRSVSLAFNFPNTMLSRMGMKKAKIYVQGQNLLTLTNYQGLDPENQSGSLPPLRRVTIGLQATF